MSRMLAHVRSNVVAYLALFVALGGTSYAAINLPAGSVGAKQIRNYSITPSKLDSMFSAGTVRAWALVSANGRVLAGARRPRVVANSGSQGTGEYSVFWKVASFKRCAAVGGTASTPTAGAPGFVLPAIESPAAGAGFVGVIVYNALGVRTDLPFYVAVLC